VDGYFKDKETNEQVKKKVPVNKVQRETNASI
jgi:hypothetical protein